MEAQAKHQQPINVHVHIDSKKKIVKKAKKPKAEKSPKPLKRKAESDVEVDAKKVKEEKVAKVYQPYSEQVLKAIEEIKQLEKDGKRNLSRDRLVELLDKKSAKILLEKLADKAKLTREERLFLVAKNSKHIELGLEPIEGLFKKGRTIGSKSEVYQCKSKHTSGQLEVFDLQKNEGHKVVSCAAREKALVQWKLNEPKRIELEIAHLQSKGYVISKDGAEIAPKELAAPSNSESDE